MLKLDGTVIQRAQALAPDQKKETEMKEDGLNLIQSAFLELTSSIGLSRDEMNAEIKESGQCEWFIDYGISYSQRHDDDLSKLLTYFEIHRKARRSNDQLTAYVALLEARLFAQNLKNLFGSIEDEIDKVMYRDPRFTWPEIPENYAFPESYLVGEH